MIKFFTTLFFGVLFYTCSTAQSPEMVVGVEVKTLEKEHQKQKIQQAYISRIQEGLTKKGIGSSKYAPFKVVGTISSGGASYTATAPVRIVHTYSFELQLENTESGEVFGTYSEQVRAVKRTEQEAVRNAIQQLSFGGNDFQEFIADAKQQIQHFYQSNCQAILASARRAHTQKNYLEAMGHLSSIPTTSTECAEETTEQMETSMLAYEAYACSQLLSKARAYVANQQPEKATALLMVIPNTATCKTDVNHLIDELQIQKDKVDKTIWERTLTLHDIETERQQMRYQFLSNIAYFNSRPDVQVFWEQEIIVVD